MNSFFSMKNDYLNKEVIKLMKKIKEETSDNITPVKPNLWSLNFVIVCLSNLTLFMVFHSLNSTLPVYIEQFGGTTKIAGLALTSLTVAAIIARMITGWSLNKYGRKLLFLTGLTLFLVPSFIYIRLIPVILLIVFRFIQGLGWGISHTSLSTVALDIVPPKRMGEGMGFFSLFNSLSMALSPAIALWLISQYSFRELFMVCSILPLATLIISLFIRYPKIENQASGYRFEFLEKAALWPSIVIFFVTFANSSGLSFLALYAIDLGLEATAAGLFFTAMALTTFISRPLSGTIVDRAGQKGFNLCVTIGTVAAAMAIFVLVYTSSPLHLLIAGLSYGLCSGFLQFIMLILSVRNAPSEKMSIANAFYWTALDTGVAAGSLFWGVVAAAFGYRMMFGLTIIPITIAAVIYFTCRAGIKHQQRNATAKNT